MTDRHRKDDEEEDALVGAAGDDDAVGNGSEMTKLTGEYDDEETGPPSPSSITSAPSSAFGASKGGGPGLTLAQRMNRRLKALCCALVIGIVLVIALTAKSKQKPAADVDLLPIEERGKLATRYWSADAQRNDTEDLDRIIPNDDDMRLNWGMDRVEALRQRAKDVHEDGFYTFDHLEDPLYRNSSLGMIVKFDSKRFPAFEDSPEYQGLVDDQIDQEWIALGEEAHLMKLERESIIGREKTFRLLRFLHWYKRYHAFALKHVSHPRLLFHHCQGYCEGWGDRVRGMLTSVVLAMATNRLFIVDEGIVPPNMQYFFRPASFQWNATKDTANKGNKFYDSNIDCQNQGHPCTTQYFKENAQIHTMWLKYNGDSASWTSSVIVQWRKKLGLYNNIFPIWRGMIYAYTFPFSERFATRFKQVVPRIPEVALHLRTGWVAADYTRFRAPLEHLVEATLDCLRKTYPRAPTVYLSADNTTVQEHFEHVLEKYTRVVTANKGGKILHVAKAWLAGANYNEEHAQNFEDRFMMDFAVFQRVRAIIHIQSGFSRQAMMTSIHADAFLVLITQGCPIHEPYDYR